MCKFLDFQKQTEPNVRNKILYLIQAWAHAFRNEPKYKVVQDTYQIMKVEGKLERAECSHLKWYQRISESLLTQKMFSNRPLKTGWYQFRWFVMIKNWFYWFKFHCQKVHQQLEVIASLWFFFFCSCCKKIFCFCLSAGHVFPEFKESDAMFAAERVRYFVFLVLLMCEESYVFVACAPYIEK